MAAKQFSREALWVSPRFAGCQPDFLRAVLCRPCYTIAEAEKTVRAFFEKGADSDARRHLDPAK